MRVTDDDITRVEEALNVKIADHQKNRIKQFNIIIQMLERQSEFTYQDTIWNKENLLSIIK